MNNYKLIIQYDGTGFSGWQIQKNAPSVQGEIQNKISMILNDEIKLTGSGRTDAGVHALGQVANFRTEKEIDLRKFNHSLNSVLSEAIAVSKVEKVNEEFHSRFDAVSRSYLYFFINKKSPFYFKYAVNSPFIFDASVEKLNGISKLITGEHDFTSFSIKKSETENKICKIKSAQWRREKDFLIFHIEANRFLHGMVRALTGTISNIAKRSEPEENILKILEAKDREKAFESFPAKGLFLYKVKY
ncbi:MAG: tRNA pseudouridine(38-40) synthase TruA [Chlorobi bacterium]|nr:tRNA pseudouridine(38-40) synthase TruA [Chlorobiota bacterium]